MKKKIGIQGIEGSYHYLAMKKFFDEEVRSESFESFRKLAKNVHSGEVDFGVIAIENSIVGTILSNIKLLLEFEIQIAGEVYMPINHCLIVKKGTKMRDLREVRSHPMAILQCHRFFEKHSQIELIESKDTASTVKELNDKNWKSIGAIASEEAAELYGMGILKKGIQTIKQNETRFIIIKKYKGNSIPNFNKASLKFTLSHSQGSLVRGLNIIADLGIDMTKIQSVPIIERPWQYSFIVDVIFDEYRNYDQMLRELRTMAIEFKILGEYKRQKN